MSPTYNQAQTTFFLSMLSNIAQQQRGTADQIEQYLAGRIDVHLQEAVPRIGQWSRVWGPAVYQAPLSSAADNVMYVARSQGSSPQMVVAIAGTNYASIYDVLIEDFYVATEVGWPYGKPPAGSRPEISTGTHYGLSILQTLTPGSGILGANQRLADFLAGALDQAMNVTTTGHSLGGALSCALALWLSDTQTTWDPAARATVCCEPSAGPTAGNADFAAYYDATLGSRTTRIYNSIDIVPHAWNDGDLSAIPALYQPAIEPDYVIYGLILTARAVAHGIDYTQIDKTTPPLAGTVDAAIIKPDAPAYMNFLTQAGYQHIDEYFTLMGVTISAEAMTAIREAMGAPAAARAAAGIRADLQRRQAAPA